MLPVLLQGIITSLLANKLPKVAEAVMDKGINYVEDKLGITLEPDMPPEKIVEIKLAAQKHEEFRIEQENKNTADARDLQKIALQQDDRFSKRFVYVLASVWSLFAMAYIYLITFTAIPTDNQRFADTILGFLLGTIIASVMNYFFGSSSGSAQKTSMMQQQMMEKQKDETQ